MLDTFLLVLAILYTVLYTLAFVGLVVSRSEPAKVPLALYMVSISYLIARMVS